MESEPETTNRRVVAAALRDHEAKFRSFVRARLPASWVEDALQTAALRAVERAETLSDPDRVLTWLYRLHRNVIVDALRKRDTRRRVFDEHRTPDADPATVGAEALAALTEANICQCSVHQVGEMKASHREILELVDLCDATLPQAAEALGVTVNTATVRLHRARKALRQRMFEHCGVTSLRECLHCHCDETGCCA